MNTQEDFVKSIERIVIIQFRKADTADAVSPPMVVKTAKSLESLEEKIAWLRKTMRDMVAASQNKARDDRNKAFVTAIEKIISEHIELGRDKIAAINYGIVGSSHGVKRSRTTKVVKYFAAWGLFPPIANIIITVSANFGKSEEVRIMTTQQIALLIAINALVFWQGEKRIFLWVLAAIGDIIIGLSFAASDSQWSITWTLGFLIVILGLYCLTRFAMWAVGVYKKSTSITW